MHIIRKVPVFSFIVIAYSWTWSLAYFVKASVYFPLLGLFGPAVAAIFISHKISGQPLKEVLKGKFTFSRKHILWYLVAVSLPLLLLIPIYFLNSGRLDLSRFKLRPLNIIDLIVLMISRYESIAILSAIKSSRNISISESPSLYSLWLT